MFSSWKLEMTGSLFTTNVHTLSSALSHAHELLPPPSLLDQPDRQPPTGPTQGKSRQRLPETLDTEKENTLSGALTSFHVMPTTSSDREKLPHQVG